MKPKRPKACVGCNGEWCRYLKTVAACIPGLTVKLLRAKKRRDKCRTR